MHFSIFISFLLEEQIIDLSCISLVSVPGWLSPPLSRIHKFRERLAVWKPLSIRLKKPYLKFELVRTSRALSTPPPDLEYFFELTTNRSLNITIYSFVPISGVSDQTCHCPSSQEQPIFISSYHILPHSSANINNSFSVHQNDQRNINYPCSTTECKRVLTITNFSIRRQCIRKSPTHSIV